MNFGWIWAALVLLTASTALAHSSELRLNITQQRGVMLAQLRFPDGQPVTGVKLKYRIGNREIVRFTEVDTGQYTAPGPGAVPLSLEIVDATFPEESTRVKIIGYTPNSTLDLVMPPAAVNYLRTSVLLPILVAPIILVVAGMTWLMTRRGSP